MCSSNIVLLRNIRLLKKINESAQKRLRTVGTFSGHFPDTITSEPVVKKSWIFYQRCTTIRTTSCQKTSKIVRAVFEKIAKNLEKRPFSALPGQYVRTKIENQKSGSVIFLILRFFITMPNFSLICSANLSNFKTHWHTHTHTDWRTIFWDISSTSEKLRTDQLARTQGTQLLTRST